MLGAGILSVYVRTKCVLFCKLINCSIHLLLSLLWFHTLITAVKMIWTSSPELKALDGTRVIAFSCAGYGDVLHFKLSQDSTKCSPQTLMCEHDESPDATEHCQVVRNGFDLPFNCTLTVDITGIELGQAPILFWCLVANSTTILTGEVATFTMPPCTGSKELFIVQFMCFRACCLYWLMSGIAISCWYDAWRAKGRHEPSASLALHFTRIQWSNAIYAFLEFCTTNFIGVPLNTM